MRKRIVPAWTSSAFNNVKKDGTIAEWEPSNQAFQCDYASLQIGIKAKYGLMVDQKEHDKLAQVLASCPTETIISTSQVKQRLTSGTSEGNNTGTANNNTTGGNIDFSPQLKPGDSKL